MEGDDWDGSNADCCQVVCDASTDGKRGGCGGSGCFKPSEEEAIAAWNTRAQASAPEGVTIVEGKDAVRAMSSFIQTGTVVPDGDIGSVRMYVDRALVGSTVYLYDHAFTRSNAKAGEVPYEVRVAIDLAMADLDYLFGRVATDGSTAKAMRDSLYARLKVIDEWMYARGAIK